MRHTKSHTKNRRSHHALTATKFVVCSNCKAQKLGHTVCSNCGFYRGMKVIDMVKKLEKKQKKAKAKQVEQEK
jgi:large subunit ribosomal protein L32